VGDKLGRMDFGLLYELGVPKPWTAESEQATYWNCLRQVSEAEKAGFTHVWAVEHHFLEEFSHSSAPEVWLTAVAQHTSKIRIGHGVVLLPHPFNHPVRVMERVAALDILSNGRVEFGTGRSLTEEELGGFGIDPADSRPMWQESLNLIKQVWTSDSPVEFDGRYVSLHGRNVYPKPVQRPHPPIWTACTSPTTYALAGENGVGVLAFGMAVSAEAMARRISEYRTELAKQPVGSHINDNVAVFLMAFCAETDAEARRVAEQSISYYMDKTMEYFLRWGKGGELPPGYEWYAEISKNRDMAYKMKFDYLYENKMILCGSPDTISGVIERFRQAGANQIIMGKQLGSVSNEEVLKSIKLVGEKVIPQFAAAQTQHLTTMAV
jgi:alkanesulfonate monooxygenase SsuD/methylene tetrahydromethanopterin reductase-like flavin-dependent oxidoreductase (luciferase family)